MSNQLTLDPVDRVEIITLYENLVDQTAPGGGVVERLRPRAGDTIVSTLLAEERRNPFVGGHGLSMLVRVTRHGITRAILFDAGGSPDGLAYNLDCLELNPGIGIVLCCHTATGIIPWGWSVCTVGWVASVSP
jgi:7,8-dihydropterin-6-yl-methyl-4-(beta-D-ribofuranosyl)aminobenzene 5'-phosphate synthase